MKAFLETDVLLDVALARTPHARDSIEVLRWVEQGGAAAVAWHSLTDCAYLLKGGGQAFLEHLLRLVEVAPVGTADARAGLCRCLWPTWRMPSRRLRRWPGRRTAS